VSCMVLTAPCDRGIHGERGRLYSKINELAGILQNCEEVGRKCGRMR